MRKNKPNFRKTDYFIVFKDVNSYSLPNSLYNDMINNLHNKSMKNYNKIDISRLLNKYKYSSTDINGNIIFTSNNKRSSCALSDDVSISINVVYTKMIKYLIQSLNFDGNWMEFERTNFINIDLKTIWYHKNKYYDVLFLDTIFNLYKDNINKFIEYINYIKTNNIKGIELNDIFKYIHGDEGINIINTLEIGGIYKSNSEFYSKYTQLLNFNKVNMDITDELPEIEFNF